MQIGMRLITLTTDFGTADWFVGTMKGVIHAISPGAPIIDLTHGVPPGHIRAGAIALAAACAYFAKGTVHVAVVDPGVGGTRLPLAVKTRNYIFIGPDNGLLSLALSREVIVEARRIENPQFHLPHPSRTFHGRDLFAPVAAHLSRGRSFTRVGARVDSFQTLDMPEPLRLDRRLEGEVLYIDRFGNALSNIPNHWVPADPRGCHIRVRGTAATIPLATHYAAVPKGRPVAVPGSTGCLEIAVYQGNAARRWGIKVGTRIQVRLPPKSSGTGTNATF